MKKKWIDNAIKKLKNQKEIKADFYDLVVLNQA